MNTLRENPDINIFLAPMPPIPEPQLDCHLFRCARKIRFKAQQIFRQNQAEIFFEN